jgi:hypothetical protein
MHKMNKRLLIVSPLTFFLFLQIGIVLAISPSGNSILMMNQGRGMDKGEGTRYGNQDGQ